MQTATGHSAYVAGTARLPLGQSFALTGKLGVSFGKVTDASPSTAATNLLLGSKTSLLVGTGAEYVLNHNVSLSVELGSYGKISNQVKGNSLTVGIRFTFWLHRIQTGRVVDLTYAPCSGRHAAGDHWRSSRTSELRLVA